MAWRNFRQMYLNYKYDLAFANLIDRAPGCTPTDTRAYGGVPAAQQIYSAKHTPEFIDSLPGHLFPDQSSQLRLPAVISRLKDLSSL